jgi:hypothetical protein
MRRYLLVALALVGCKKRHEIAEHAREVPTVAVTTPAPAPAPTPTPEPEPEPAKPEPAPLADATCVRVDTGGAVADVDHGALRICTGPFDHGDARKHCLEVAKDGTVRPADAWNDTLEGLDMPDVQVSDDRQTVSICTKGKACVSIAPQLAAGEEVFSAASDGLGDFKRLVTVTEAHEDAVYANVEVWDFATGARIAGTTVRAAQPTDISARMLGDLVAVYSQPQHDAPDLDVGVFQVQGDQLHDVARWTHVTESPVEMDAKSAAWIEADRTLHLTDLATLKDTSVIPLDWLVDPAAPGWKDRTGLNTIGRDGGIPVLLASRGVFPGDAMRVGYLDLAGGKHVAYDVPICPATAGTAEAVP